MDRAWTNDKCGGMSLLLDGGAFALLDHRDLMSHRTALLVAPNKSLSTALSNSLRRAGYRLTVVGTFDAAKRVLNRHPDVLITELKLAEYNGLQLVLRGQTLGIPSIVVADKTFEHEVEQFGAAWLSPETVGEELELTLGRALDEAAASSVGLWSAGIEADAPRATAVAAGEDSFFDVLH